MRKIAGVKIVKLTHPQTESLLGKVEFSAYRGHKLLWLKRNPEAVVSTQSPILLTTALRDLLSSTDLTNYILIMEMTANPTFDVRLKNTLKIIAAKINELAKLPEFAQLKLIITIVPGHNPLVAAGMKVVNQVFADNNIVAVSVTSEQGVWDYLDTI